MKQKIAVMMNTNKLGGAERSLLLQLSTVKNVELTFFIPKLDGHSTLKPYIEKEKLGTYKEYDYPSSLYSLSRSRILPGLSAAGSVVSLLFGHAQLNELAKIDHIYLNGNKVAFLFFLLNINMKFKGKITWHLRDYYHHSTAGSLLWRFLTNVPKDKLEFICNSYSVQKQLQLSPWKEYSSRVVYNPSGGLQNDRAISSVETIGFVSMLAPWKGIHELMFFAWMYEKELLNLGIRQIKIFGDSLYQTAGAHSTYKEELKRLSDKFPSSLISFEGLCEPKEIFSQIDCLIHYSLDEEPFGRVLVEAYEAGVPVITTGLGGAGEILESNVNGYKVVTYDRRDLFNKIKNITTNNVLRMRFITKSMNKAEEIQKNIAIDMEKILSVKEVS